MPQLDVLYMTRIQRERFVDPLEYERCKGVYVLTRRKLDRARKDLLVMHPLPRVDEISIDVDDDPRAVYFEQAPVRHVRPYGPCSPIWPTRSASAPTRWRSAPSRYAPTPTALPRPSTTCPPW